MNASNSEELHENYEKEYDTEKKTWQRYSIMRNTPMTANEIMWNINKQAMSNMDGIEEGDEVPQMPAGKKKSSIILRTNPDYSSSSAFKGLTSDSDMTSDQDKEMRNMLRSSKVGITYSPERTPDHSAERA